jgi:FkbM family methyltransferase
MRDARRRVQVKCTRLLTRTLRILGLRDGIRGWRAERKRRRRTAAEAVGDDRLSRPALHDLDAKLDAIIARERGFFVEAGAHDGFTQSNTYYLERFRGWRGVLVEPIPEQAAEARVSRPDATVVQCALVSADDARQRVRMSFGDLMSIVVGVKDADWTSNGTMLGWYDPYEIDVEARTLSSVLDEVRAPEIDLLSLDIEGCEAEALRGLDLDRHAPRFILVEIHDRVGDRPSIDLALGDRYVAQGWLSPIDLLYVRADIGAARPTVQGGWCRTTAGRDGL